MVRPAPQVLAPPGRRELELARHRRRLRPGHARLLHRHPRPAPPSSPTRPRAGRRQGRLRPLAQGPVRPARHLDLELELPDQRLGLRQEKAAAWLFIQWAGSKEVQAAPPTASTAPTSASASTAPRSGARPSTPRFSTASAPASPRRRWPRSRRTPTSTGARACRSGRRSASRGDGGAGRARRPGRRPPRPRRRAGAGRRDHEAVSGGPARDGTSCGRGRAAGAGRLMRRSRGARLRDARWWPRRSSSCC